MKKIVPPLLFCGFLFAPQTQAQTVKVSWNSNAQFSRYRTYSWKQATDPGDPIFGQWVQPDVDAQLRAVGLQFLYPGQSPDLLVIYRVQTPEKVQSTTTMEGYEWGDGPWVGFGNTAGENEAEGLPPVVTETTGHPYTMGIVTVDLVDAKRKQIIWRGQATIKHLARSDKDQENEIAKSIQKMFRKFPPG